METNAMGAETVSPAFLLDTEDLERCSSVEKTTLECPIIVYTSHQLQDRFLISTDVTKTNQPIGQRQQITALKHELNALTQRLCQLHDDRMRQQEFIRQENARSSPRSLAHWKQQAQQQRTTRRCSEKQLQRLTRMMMSTAQRMDRIHAVLNQQMASLRENPQLQLLPSPRDENASDRFVFRLLKSTLDAQHAQFDLLLSQCRLKISPTCQCESVTHEDGAGVDVHLALVSPFHVAFINEAFRRYTQELPNRRCFGYSIDNDTFYQGSIETTTKATSHDSLRVFSGMRRIVCDQYIAIVWASQVDCPDDRLTICKNGWSIVKPIAEYDQEASFTQSIESVNVFRSDGSSRHPIDRVTKRFMRSIEQYAQAESQIIENHMFDAKLAWERNAASDVVVGSS